MPKISDLKKNNIVRIGEQICKIKQMTRTTPTARGGNTQYKVILEDVQTRQRLDQTFRSEDVVQEVDLERRSAQYLFQDGEEYTFMNNEDYAQYTMHESLLEGQTEWLEEGMEDLLILFLEGKPMGVQLPQSVELEIVECVPPMRGATATAQTKPAKLENGVEIQVPDYIETGDRVKVATDGRFITRV